MQVLQNKIWLSSLLLLVIHQITQKVFAWNLGLIDGYLDPFLSMPIYVWLFFHFVHLSINKNYV